ncbi:MAG: sigma-70 family RNA polymerase sigma factor [Gemmatimonadetes bacterium]|nr:sigma-70 family RNA polymerase sigma factor [Gemmatimonadota bacterium]
MTPTTEERRRQFEAEALPHLDAVYRYAHTLTGDPTQAEDLTQETMLKALRAWHQFERGSNARAWLLTILRNTFINEYRRRQHQGETVDLAGLEPYHVFREVQEVDPEGRFFANIVDDEVLRAIGALPEEFREVVWLSDVEGFPYAEIARLLEVPIGTVKSRLFRARHALQQRLYDYAVEMGYVKRRAS